MAHDIVIDKNLTKAQRYDLVYKQLEALTNGEHNLTANLANTTALLKEVFGWFWVGFYLVDNQSQDKELVLNAFQGSVACTRIRFGKGVCGTAWRLNETLIVEDVEQFEGHIACSSLSRSEIVVPIIVDSKVVAVLDIDSTELASFDMVDKEEIERLCGDLVAKFWNK